MCGCVCVCVCVCVLLLYRPYSTLTGDANSSLIKGPYRAVRQRTVLLKTVYIHIDLSYIYCIYISFYIVKSHTRTHTHTHTHTHSCLLEVQLKGEVFLLHNTQNPVGPSVSWPFETDCKQDVLFCSVLFCSVLFCSVLFSGLAED